MEKQTFIQCLRKWHGVYKRLGRADCLPLTPGNIIVGAAVFYGAKMPTITFLHKHLCKR